MLDKAEHNANHHNSGNQNPDLLWRVVDGEALILDVSSGYYFSLNPVATEVWQGLHDGESQLAIIEKIAQKYGISSETAQNDVTELIEDLRTAKLWG